MDREAEQRLRSLYAEHGGAVLAYGLRRGASAEDAADLVAEVFLVAWRRIGDVPSGEEARLWLYGVARHALANQRRGERRRSRLSEALREHVRALPAPAVEPVDPALQRALRSLPEIDRGLLALIAWEGLTPTQAAKVLGLHPATARARLHRARGRLRRALAEEPTVHPLAEGALR